MEVVDTRSALLSNFEVLSLLRELETVHLAGTKIKKEEETGSISTIIPGERHPSNVEVIQNLRTIEVEAIKYLSADYQTANSQTEQGVTQLVNVLKGYDLTKAEKLQVVNLTPTLPVELYVIVEELEDRLGDSMNELLSKIQSTLTTRTAAPSYQDDILMVESTSGAPSNIWGAEFDADDVEYHDRGEGAGVEGDLDVDDD